MVSTKTTLNEIKHDFGKELTEEPVVEFPLYAHPDALPHQPPKDWVMKPKDWIHLRWIDPVIPPTVEGLEGIAFIPYDFNAQADTMKRLTTTSLDSNTFKLLVKGRAQFFLEDYCHIPKDKGYWCRIGQEGMMAHEYIISEDNEKDVFIPVCIYHFAFGLRFPLHPFFSQILCHFQLSLNQLLPQATRKILSFYLDL